VGRCRSIGGSGTAIKPEDVERLNRIFTLTLQSWSLVDRNDPICEIVADIAGAANLGDLLPALIFRECLDRRRR